MGDHSFNGSLVSPGQQVGIYTPISSILAMLIGAGEGIMTPHTSQSELLLVIHRRYWLGSFSLPLVLHLIIAEGICVSKYILRPFRALATCGGHFRDAAGNIFEAPVSMKSQLRLRGGQKSGEKEGGRVARDMVLFPAAHDDRAQDDGFKASVIDGTKARFEFGRILGDNPGGRCSGLLLRCDSDRSRSTTM
jgi:hypothetical protein